MKKITQIPTLPTGRHIASDGSTVEITPAIIKDIADSYDPALSEAPLVIGHPKINAIAYGWAQSLTVADDMLYAQPHQVNPDFAEAVNSGALKKRSASIYGPSTPGNPKPGHWYLRHIGFLGAHPPAIKGLPDIEFSDNADAILIEFADPDNQPRAEVDPASPADGDAWDSLPDGSAESASAGNIIPNHPEQSMNDPKKPDAPTPDASKKPESTPAQETAKAQAAAAVKAAEVAAKAADFAESQAALDKREADIKARETKLAADEAKKRRDQAKEFAEALADKGQLLPRHIGPMTELMVSMDSQPVLEFAEGDATIKKAPQQILREFLSELPAQIDFAEKSGDGKVVPEELQAERLAELADEYRQAQLKLGKKISVAQAVEHIKRTKGIK